MVLDQSQPFETGDLTSDDSKLHASKAEEMSSSDSTNISPVRTQFGDTYQNHSTTRTILLLASVFASSFLVGLDRNVLATAIPKITNEFNSIQDVGWYGSAFTLACCSSQLLVGKFYTFYSVKAVYIVSVGIFEVGSAVSGSAQSSIALIIGRAIAGFGASGIYAGCIVCIMCTIPLEKRPTIQGGFTAVSSVASIAGPLVGGAFTSNLTWRWCFYINIPFGAIVLVILATCLRVPARDDNTLTWKKKLWNLDLPGTFALIPCVVCLLLALAWGEQKLPWNNGRIIALLTLAGIFGIIFVTLQVLLPQSATIPSRIFRQRSVVASCWSSICYGGAQTVLSNYLPIWFQSINGDSAIKSGIQLLPVIIATCVSSIIFGIATQKVGYYTPFAIMGSCIMSIGAGLFTILRVGTDEGKLIGYQIILGFGQGFCFQAPNLAVQVVLSARDVPVGASLMVFAQLLGSTVFNSVGENILVNQLVQRLSDVPGFNRNLISSSGATSVLSALPQSDIEQALVAYNEALRMVFVVGLTLACLTVLGTATLEWKSILKRPNVEDQGGPKIEAAVDGTEKAAASETS